ncbi:cytochrome c biogenesis protein CcdA [Dysgonomonas sp. PFB1-18]|uniref:hypothetical protein n=1 Tax=unclassified Dysgonomonas TaxID=2630389 RepID=UPI0024735B14|nr:MULTISPECIES: hypothetical protein [unclassified Dysgonomonas]MDH6308349.1 cytochrome c biogenesis protein CcdA [Dysgonomonas sp. PF1-14]MDH6338214.1 cytochrome c biogenesis protein CcdA [Dysgonomonas sp. PF1-16]MDH6379711.1 cytochrome c biogenesis protein CcdA [Dysgonomonas sp. PFB1-18]MDH6397200.1 cytochrome c biogenesis protein CcdA [Dysgonomonas sp. PF1-23]
MKEENKSPKSPVRMIYGIFMVFFYLCISVLLVFTPVFDNVHMILRIIMGVLFFIYGLFRGYRMWKNI